MTYDAVNAANDQAQLKNMVDRAKEVIAVKKFDDTTKRLIKKRVKEVSKIKAYDIEKFKYNSEADTYTCPDGYVVSFDSRFSKDGHFLKNINVVIMIAVQIGWNVLKLRRGEVSIDQ